MKKQDSQDATQSTLVCFNDWLNKVGVSRTTGWRWRKTGIIHTVCIAGRQYLLQEQIEEFSRRALAGEFEKVGSSDRAGSTECYGNMPKHLAEARGLLPSKHLHANPANAERMGD